MITSIYQREAAGQRKDFPVTNAVTMRAAIKLIVKLIVKLPKQKIGIHEVVLRKINARDVENVDSSSLIVGMQINMYLL